MFGIVGIVVGIVLGVIGVFMVFFFPANSSHQPQDMTLTAVVLGIILLALAGILIFLP